MLSASRFFIKLIENQSSKRSVSTLITNVSKIQILENIYISPFMKNDSSIIIFGEYWNDKNSESLCVAQDITK